VVIGMQPSVELEPGQKPQSSNHLADLILDSEIPKDIIRYLSAHRDQFVDMLRSSGPQDLHRKFLRLEGRLMAAAEAGASEGQAEPVEPVQQSAPQRRSQPASRAPAPIKPVQGSASKGAPDPEKMSDDEYFAWREAQDRAAAG
jgi:hypothetical protein